MLVLSRKAGQKIQIGENITIEVRRVAGNRVTVSVDAPRELRILRGEIAQAVAEFEEAPESAPDVGPIAGAALSGTLLSA